MTVGELKQKLENIPDDVDCMVAAISERDDIACESLGAVHYWDGDDPVLWLDGEEVGEMGDQ